MKTYSQKPSEVTRQWHLVDATDIRLGRLSTVVAQLLIGKHKPTYTPHIDGGDVVVVINSDKIATTGNKTLQKRYFKHSGYPGGISSKTLQQRLEEDSRGAIEDAVRRMMPANRLRDGRMMRLKVYRGAEHPHEAQQPKALGVDNG